MTIVVRVTNLSKQYRIGGRQARYKTIREGLMQALYAPIKQIKTLMSGQSQLENSIWALKDVSFEVERGDVVGIIGRNGAGKSTLLKVLSRITKPTGGRIEIRGRIGSLLEVGTGFHPELTGRENIYLNGAILGMRRTEIDRKFDEIVAFSEIEKFLDTPVKHYSSGMYMRLAFSVAAHLEPEILLVDEVLAVGDAAFQKKCLGKMGDVAKEGRTVLFVSHNMGAIENLCSKTILLDQGTVCEQGPSSEVISYYLRQVLPSVVKASSLEARTDRSGNGKIRLTSFHLEDPSGHAISHINSGNDVVFAFGYQSVNHEELRDIDMGFSISTNSEVSLFVLYSSYMHQSFHNIPEKGYFRCVVRNFPLSPGEYIVGARVTVGGEEADWPFNGVGFIKVETGDFYRTGKSGFESYVPFMIAGEWDVK